MDMWTIGFADRLRLPRFPSKLGRRGNARRSPLALADCVFMGNSQFLAATSSIELSGTILLSDNVRCMAVLKQGAAFFREPQAASATRSGSPALRVLSGMSIN
jgi:hypothetical protein